jgi:amino acid transporter
MFLDKLTPPRRKANGHTLDELPYQASFGVYGSYICVLINAVALIAQFYVALYPVGGPNLDTQTFFQLYLAGPLLLFLYVAWKSYSWFKRPADRPLFIKLKDIDIYSGMREGQFAISGDGVSPETRRASIQEMADAKKKKTAKDHVMGVVRSIF